MTIGGLLIIGAAIAGIVMYLSNAREIDALPPREHKDDRVVFVLKEPAKKPPAPKQRKLPASWDDRGNDMFD